jgi:hypothetical protein
MQYRSDAEIDIAEIAMLEELDDELAARTY